MSGALEGIRILELAEYGQVPGAAAMLADMGADVVKIEQPGRGDGARENVRLYGESMALPGGNSRWYETCNRNKRGMTLNVRNPGARDIVYRLIRRFDVFTTSLKPGLIEEAGLDYESLCKHNPRIIFSYGSAFGMRGPDSDMKGFDWAGLGRSGLTHRVMGPEMKYTNLVDGLADQAGAIMVAQGILAALVARQRTGRGQVVESSLLGTVINLQRIQSLEFALQTGKEMPHLERAKSRSPLQNMYQCKDGRWLALLMMQSDKFWPGFCRALGLAELIDSPDFCDRHARSKHAAELLTILDKTFASRTYAEWAKILAAAEMMFAPILTQMEVGDDPQALANDYIIEYDLPHGGKLKTTGFPVWFSETPCSMKSAAPDLGQHNEEVLVELGGYTRAEIARFKEQGVI